MGNRKASGHNAPAGVLSDRAFTGGWGVLLALGLVWRVGYVWSQPASDPYFAQPLLDGEYYLDWARRIVGGEGFTGAYYLAPLYPLSLSVFLATFGERFGLLYLLQQLIVLAAIALIGLEASRRIGRLEGCLAVALLVAYQPLLFFASRPLSEPLAVLLLAVAIFVADRDSDRSYGLVGAAAGLASLARPNLLLAPALWILAELVSRRPRRALLLASGLVLILFPVACRNFVASGHIVLISSNSGITAYHGNGPGANGLFLNPEGFSGVIAQQRDEATAIARVHSGRDLDPVQADRWWGQAALATRLDAPLDTMRLLIWRALLLIDSQEHALGYHPVFDANPWRLAWPLGGIPIGERMPYAPARTGVPIVPFGLLLGLAAAGLVLRGFGGTGGWRIWTTLSACAAMPMLFFVSSRYRLPLAFVLAVPAAAGLGGLLGFSGAATPLRRASAWVAALGCLALSFQVPSEPLQRGEIGVALNNTAATLNEAGEPGLAERYARLSIGIDPKSEQARFNLGVFAAAQGKMDQAEASFRQALSLRPDYADAAVNLAVILLKRGAPQEAVAPLRRAIRSHPTHQASWNLLTICLAASGQRSEAQAVRRQALGLGVALRPDLERWLKATPSKPTRP